MQDRPTAPELADAVRDFVERELLPTVGDARLRFRTLVALNALGILARELAAADAPLLAEHADLAALLGADPTPPPTAECLQAATLALRRQLSRLIREGRPPEGAGEMLQRSITRKLQLASPRYLGR